LVQTDNGNWVYLPIIWEIGDYDPFQNGPYILTGTIVIPNSWENQTDRLPNIMVVVLQKDGPIDLVLSNDIFTHDDNGEPIFVGDFTVIDPIDDIHILELVPGALDNSLFVIVDNQLYWNNSSLMPGETTFTVLVRVTDRDGNVFEKEFTITRRINDLSDLEIPNTFTPDGDNINDEWGMTSLKIYKGVKMHIFERSGLRVFFTDNADKKWDGTYLGKEMPVGTYYYVIEIEDTKESRKGILNLLRK
jgi:gliding motility-associated-like protein